MYENIIIKPVILYIDFLHDKKEIKGKKLSINYLEVIFHNTEHLII